MRAASKETVLAICPFTRGLAFTFFEGPLSPIDWGTKEVRHADKNRRSLVLAEGIIMRLQPDIIVLEDGAAPFGRRSQRIRKLQRAIGVYAHRQAIEVRTYTRSDLRDCFKKVGAFTRHEIASAIGSRIHAFGIRTPRERKLWQSEDTRMGLFDAASLAMTFYCHSGQDPFAGG